MWGAVAQERATWKTTAKASVAGEYGIEAFKNFSSRLTYVQWLLGDTSKDHVCVFLYGTYNYEVCYPYGTQIASDYMTSYGLYI